jgi:peptidoglycan hydrolase CwlO-like protein
MKLTRSLFNQEYNVNEIDDECQAIDDEWIEFSSDFDDQKQEINKTENDMKKLDSEINRHSQWLREQENSFQLMIASQSTLEMKLDKLEQIKVTKFLFFQNFHFK